MKNVRTRLYATALAVGLSLTAVSGLSAPAQAISNPPIPILTVDHFRTISSHPFPGAPGNASDVEGLGYVGPDNSMWVADDNGDRVWEIDPTNGDYKSQLRGGAAGTAFLTATQVGTGLTCGQALDPNIVGDTAAYECLSRTDDLESAIYDSSADVLYVFSGNCCSNNLPAGYPYHPTAWKLTRNSSGDFTPTSWQALPEGQDATAGGWRPDTGLYIGQGTKIRTYNFDTNALGSEISLPVSPIVGITFTSANVAFVTTATANTASGRTTASSDSTIHRFDITGNTWTKNVPWTFWLGGTGMIDARDLAIVGDTFYVTDGYDSRPGGDHPIYVYTLGSAPAPTASFTAIPSTGRAPFDVNFTDTSTGNPTSWAWDFDNNGTVDSTAQNPPAYRYRVAGNYTAKLTATNAAGSTSATQQIRVNPATALPGGYTLDGFGGLHPFRVGTGPQPPAIGGGPYWPGWDIARGVGIFSNRSAGYILDGFGGVHGFRIGAGAPPKAVSGGPYWPGWDIARGIAVLPNRTGGYIVDGFGGVHGFRIGSGPMPPTIVGVPYRPGQDRIRGITITPDGKGGYANDKSGVLYRFRIGTDGVKPPVPNNVFTTNVVDVHGVALISEGTGGLTIDGWGGLHRFGVGVNAPPPAVAGAMYWPGWSIARDVGLLPD